MKRLLLILCMLLLVGTLASCSRDDETKDVSEALGIDLSGGQMVKRTDTHDGFHGDGYTFTQMRFDKTAGVSAAKQMDNGGGWSRLPLNENLQRAVYGKEDGDASYGALVQTDEGEALIPAIEHGYYYFYDRHSESGNPRDSTQLFNRSSYNFTIALYDADNRNLYCYELDT